MLRELMKRSLWPITPWSCFEGDSDDGGGDDGGGGEPVSIIDSEGNFVEDFHEKIDDDDLKGNLTLKQLVGQNVKDSLRMLVHAQRKVGMNKIPLPKEDADDSEWNEVYKAIGKPETPQDYPYKRPENVPAEARTPEILKAMRERAHALNWTKKQWNAYIKQEDEQLIDDIETKDTNDRAELDRADKKLNELWGMAKEERVNLANRVINETIPEEAGKLTFSRADFIAKYGRDPMVIEWLAGLGQEMAEHEALIADLSQKAPKEAQAELDDLHASEDYKNYTIGILQKTNPSKAKAIERRETELYQIIYNKSA